LTTLNISLLSSFTQVWFKNRRAKCRQQAKQNHNHNSSATGGSEKSGKSKKLKSSNTAVLANRNNSSVNVNHSNPLHNSNNNSGSSVSGANISHNYQQHNIHHNIQQHQSPGSSGSQSPPILETGYNNASTASNNNNNNVTTNNNNHSSNNGKLGVTAVVSSSSGSSNSASSVASGQHSLSQHHHGMAMGGMNSPSSIGTHLHHSTPTNGAAPASSPYGLWSTASLSPMGDLMSSQGKLTFVAFAILVVLVRYYRCRCNQFVWDKNYSLFLNG